MLICDHAPTHIFPGHEEEEEHGLKVKRHHQQLLAAFKDFSSQLVRCA